MALPESTEVKKTKTIHRWPPEEESCLYDTLDLFAARNYPTVAECVKDIHQHLHSVFAGDKLTLTEIQITNKISGLARGLHIQSRDLLLHWNEYGPKLRTGLEKNKPLPKPRNRPTKGTDNLITPSTESRPVPSGKRKASQPAHVDFQTQPESTSLRSPQSDESMTASLASEEVAADVYSNKERSSHIGRYNMELNAPEVKLIRHLREHEASTRYLVPPSKAYIQGLLQKTMKNIDRSFDFFLSASSMTATPSVANLTADSIKIVHLLTNTPDNDAIERKFDALIAVSSVSDRALYRAITAAVIHKWILNSFDEHIRHIGSSECSQCAVFNIYEEYNHHAVRNLKVARVNAYIDNSLQSRLPTLASDVRKRLYRVLRNLFDLNPRVSGQANNSFEPRLQSFRGWDECLDTALLKVFEIRARMARCSLTYGFRFPVVGDRFTAEWMEHAHGDKALSDEDEVVHMCLRPAVFSHDIHDDAAAEVVVSPALVMVEGYSPDLTMT